MSTKGRGGSASFVFGMGAGILAGVLISIQPVVFFASVAVALAAVAVSVARSDAPRAMLASGYLVAAGCYLAYGAIGTIVTCSQTDDFCGRANAWPIVVGALVTLGAGAGAAVITATRQRAR